MHSVKIEFCLFDWYSSSPTTIVLYNKMYKSISKQSQKTQNRKSDLHEISSASPKAGVGNLRPRAGSGPPQGFIRPTCA